MVSAAITAVAGRYRHRGGSRAGNPAAIAGFTCANDHRELSSIIASIQGRMRSSHLRFIRLFRFFEDTTRFFTGTSFCQQPLTLGRRPVFPGPKTPVLPVSGMASRQSKLRLPAGACGRGPRLNAQRRIAGRLAAAHRCADERVQDRHDREDGEAADRGAQAGQGDRRMWPLSVDQAASTRSGATETLRQVRSRNSTPVRTAAKKLPLRWTQSHDRYATVNCAIIPESSCSRMWQCAM